MQVAHYTLFPVSVCVCVRQVYMPGHVCSMAGTSDPQNIMVRMQSRRSRLDTKRFQGSLIHFLALVGALAVQKFPLRT